MLPEFAGATATERFAAFTESLDARKLPTVVLTQAKWAILDLLGIAIGGADLPFARLIRNYFGEIAGRPEATAVGVSERLPAANAALVNAVCGHTLDMQDGHRYAEGHPGGVIPAALAAGEVADASGADLLAATVAGYEVFIRVASQMNPAHVRRGFHTTGTVGSLGSAAAAGRVLGLNAKQLVHALGIASVQFGGLMLVVRDGASVKPLHPGKAAAAGVLSAVLAQRGAEGPRAPLEGDHGYIAALSGISSLDGLTEGLGASYAIGGSYFKLHAACRHIHPALDVMLELRRQYRLTASDVEQVEVRTYAVAHHLTGTVYQPQTISAAKFSLPFSVALAIGLGTAGPTAYSDANLADPALAALAKKVRVVADSELDAGYPGRRAAAVTIRTKDGHTLHGSTDLARGEPELPATAADLEAKFRSNAESTLGALRVNELLDAVLRLEQLRVRHLVALLPRRPSPHDHVARHVGSG